MSAPVLDLSGPALRDGFDRLLEATASVGGIGAMIEMLRAKSAFFGELAGGGRAITLEETGMLALANFMPTVRRRIGGWIERNDVTTLPPLLAALLDRQSPIAQRWAGFLSAFPTDRAHRWVRDFGAELLHFTAPDQAPLMCRWIWDRGTGTGLLRQIWYDDAPQSDPGAIADDPTCFAVLADEIGGFLRDHGVFRDVALTQDLLMAHIYADYINDRGASFLNAESKFAADPLAHTRRMLGLDIIGANGMRARVKLPADFNERRGPRARLGNGDQHADS